MLAIKKIESLDDLHELKQQYFALATAPLDGMWHFGFVPMADHFGFYEHDQLVGYCCINAEAYMLQFYLAPTAKTQARELFTLIAQQNSAVIGAVKGAFVSTAEPDYLSLCLDNSSAFKVNALMYRKTTVLDPQQAPAIDMTLAKSEQLSDFVEFAVRNIGAPEQWVTGYFANLIKRQELWGYWSEGKLLASGECRLFDEHQTTFADLGMIVAKSKRGQGLATRIVHHLAMLAMQRDLTPICSTERGNIGAQKAISSAGLTAVNRLIQIEFLAS